MCCHPVAKGIKMEVRMMNSELDPPYIYAWNPCAVAHATMWSVVDGGTMLCVIH